MTRTGYVLKVYPRLSETFVVTEILARQQLGDDLRIYALRPTTDARFHPEIARVEAEVSWLPRAQHADLFWEQLGRDLAGSGMQERFAGILPELAQLPADEVAQGVGLARAVMRDQITHLHAHFASLAGRMAWVAHRLTGVPYTLTTHAKDIHHESVDPVWLRRICGDADRVIAISSFNLAHLDKVLAGTGARVVLCRNALELDRFEFRPPRQVPRGPLRVLGVGRLVPKKGFADMITAIGELVRAGTEVEARIAGDGELRNELQELIDAQGLGSHIELLGSRSQREVIDLLHDADVFVAPCVVAADGNIDGLPTVVLEAMAVGTPVIATSVSGLPEVIVNGQTGILIPPGDVAALTDSLQDIADGRVELRAMAGRARELIEAEYDSRVQAATLSAWESSGRSS